MLLSVNNFISVELTSTYVASRSHVDSCLRLDFANLRIKCSQKIYFLFLGFVSIQHLATSLLISTMQHDLPIAPPSVSSGTRSACCSLEPLVNWVSNLSHSCWS